MILLLIGALGLVGGTTWLALNTSVARRPALHRRLTGTGLALCLAAAVVALVAAFTAYP